MRHTTHIKHVIAATVFAFAVVALAGTVFHGVIAQSDSGQSGNGGRGQGIEISPPRIQLDADPGETVTAEINLRNITDLEVLVQGTVNDFVAGNESGEPRILFEEDDESPYSLKEYISEVPDLTLEPDQRRTISIEINVPENASPGGHFGVVRFSGIPAETSGDSSEVNLSASIGTLILLNVSGDVNEEMSIEEFAVAKDGETSRFFETGPVTLVTRLNNTGNVHLQPSGSLNVTNMFGQEVAGRALNENQGNVLPESVRRFEHELSDKDFWFGRYTATAQLQYGSDDTALQETATFWVIPYKLIAIVLVMIIAVGFFGRRALRAYKRSVVKKYHEQQNSHRNDTDQQSPGM